MCGITGLWQGENRGLSRDSIVRLVNAMNDSIIHRGPDSDGVWAEAAGRCALGQRRLSVIDTSEAGRQPFASTNGRWWITYNGELYNFQDLRRDLCAAGIRFRGRTDTEVVLEAVALWGVEALSRFDGMFAFAVYDIETRTLLLARDPFGEKPLYYTALPGGGLAFASELHALELLPGIDLTVDVEAVGELLCFQYIGAPRSIYSSIKKLPPGHWLRVDADGRQRIERYFAFEPGSNGYTSRSKADLIDELEDILVRSIRGRLIADVPLGAFLSGGVDSSTVCALVRSKLTQPLKTFSTGFAGASESEHLIARKFANLLGTDHHEQLVDPQAAEFLYKIGGLLDEPNADSSCLPVYTLSEFARKHVTVAVSGDGGDELFGGYGRYLSTLKAAATEPSSFRAGDYYYGWQILVSPEPHIIELFGFLPPGLANHLASLRRDLNGAPTRDLLARLRRSDAWNYMPGAVLAKVDRMSMRHALEVRTPFLNVELAQFAERLPPEMLTDGQRGKVLLRELAYRYLPRDIIDLPKQGFGLPMSDWARASLLGVANDMLGSYECRLVPLFGREGLERFLARQNRSDGFAAYQVWALAMLESWLRHHPASVPDLAPMRAKGPANGKAETKVETTVAARVAESIWLVSTGAPDRLADPRLLPTWEAVPLALQIRVAHLIGHAEGSGMVRPDTVHLPEPGQPLSSTDAARLRALEGATLVFLGGAISEKLNYAELLKYWQLRVSRLIYVIRSDDRHTEEITLQPKARRRRILHCARLFLRSRAIISNRKLFGFLLRAKPFASEADTVNAAPGLKRLPNSGMAELSDRFIAFEGLRQLLPLSATPADVAHLGSGRYSIMNRTLRFSPTNSGRQFRLPYWVVERTPKTEPLLQFVRNTRAMDENIVAALNATRIGTGIWLVARHAIAAPLNLRQNLSWLRGTPGILTKILVSLDPTIRADPEGLLIPDWRIPLSVEHRKQLQCLRGMTLIFADPDAGGWCGYAELQKFAQLGVDRLIFRAHDDPHAVEEVKLRPKSLAMRIREALYLFSRARAIVTNGWPALLGVWRHFSVQGSLSEVFGFNKLAGVSDRYAVFERLRELPPIKVSRGEIALRGGGLYRIADGTLSFSRTGQGRGGPYWIVERTEDSQQLLQWWPQTYRPSIPSRLVNAMDALLNEDVDRNLRVRPGDRIVVVTGALYVGGAERQWIYLARGLKNAGYDVTFVVYSKLNGDFGHYLPLLREAGVRLKIVPAAALPLADLLATHPVFQYFVASKVVPDLSTVYALAGAFRQLQPKAVIAQLDGPNLIAGAAALLAAVPRIVMSFRNYNPSNFPYLCENWLRPAYALLTRSKRVLLSGNTAVCNHDYERWIGVEPGRSVCIPNAIDFDHFPEPSAAEIAAARRELSISEDTPVVLGVFRLSNEKRPEVFVEVCARLLTTYPQLRVLVAGVGPLLDGMRRLVSERGVANNIQFLGRRNDVGTLMAIADLLLLTSAQEGMPNVVIEAQRMRLPVVATDAGGTRGAFLPGRSGLLCPVGDLDALQTACLQILADPILADRMGEVGYRHAATEFALDLMAQRYVDLINGGANSNLVPRLREAQQA
jgi:asparagine synthase (glutamine-hydrolysing)